MSDDVFEPAVLLWGEDTDLLRLAAALIGLTAEDVSLKVNDLPECLSADGTVLFARLAPNGHGLKILSNEVPATYSWDLRPEDVSNFVGKIQALAASPDSGRVELECLRRGESMIVILSKGEYPDDFLRPEE